MKEKIEQILNSMIANLAIRKGTKVVINETVEKLKQLYIETQNCELDYDDNKMCGDIAKEFGMSIGEIGCPHCGVGHHGIVGRICGWCDADMFSSDSRSLYRILYDAAEKRNSEIRKGQEIFNIASKMFPKEVMKLVATESDCFYNDSKITYFIESLIHLINYPKDGS